MRNPPHRHKRIAAALALAGLIMTLAACQGHADGWTILQEKNALEGTTETFALRAFAIAGGGQLETKVTCAYGLVNFRLTYLNAAVRRDGGPALLWSTDADKPYVAIRARLDDGEIVVRPSQSAFRNVAEAHLYDAEAAWLALQDMARAVKPGASRNGAPDVGASLEAGFKRMVIGLSYPEVIRLGLGPVEAFNSGRKLLFEVPLSDGRTANAEIERADPVLRGFLDSCAARGLTGLRYSMQSPRPTCVAGDRLYVRDGAEIFKEDTSEPSPNSLVGGQIVTLLPTTSPFVPPTLCKAKVPAQGANFPSYDVSLLRSDLRTQAEWDADYASDRDRTWAGTVEEFETALRRLLQAYAAGLGIDPTQYDNDIAYVKRLAATCAAVPRSALKKDYRGSTSWTLTPDQADCKTFEILVDEKLGRPSSSRRGLLLRPDLSRLGNGSGGFRLSVFVAPPDKVWRSGLSLFHQFGIIAAEFPPRP